MDQIAREQAQDDWEVEMLYDLCFAPGREALSSYRLRAGVPPVPALCLTVRDGGGFLGGAVRVWPVCVQGAGQVWPALLLGPIAVHPTRQGEGLGGALMREVHHRAAAMGAPRILLVGDAEYYRRFGYSRLDGVMMPPPTNPARVLGRGAWSGVGGRVLPADAGRNTVPKGAGQAENSDISADR